MRKRKTLRKLAPGMQSLCQAARARPSKRKPQAARSRLSSASQDDACSSEGPKVRSTRSRLGKSTTPESGHSDYMDSTDAPDHQYIDAV